MKRLSIIMFIIISSFHFAYAQNILHGKVEDIKTGKELENVNILIHVLKTGTVTNSKGEYKLSDIPSGVFDVQFSRIGYKALIKRVNIASGSFKLNVNLQPTELEIGEVVVLGNNVETQEMLPYKAEVITRRQLQNNSAPTLTSALALLPGISEISSGIGISRPVVRGLSGYRVETLVDGLRFDNQMWQNEHGLGLDDIGIGKVEIIEGPAALIYGAEAVGGVINLVHENNAPVGTVVGNYNLQILSNTLGANSDIGLKGSGEKLKWQVHLGGQSNADYLNGRNNKVPNTRFTGITAKGLLSYSTDNSVSDLQYTFSHHIFGVVEAADLHNPKDLTEDHFERGFDGPHHIIDFHIVSLENTYFTGNSRIKLNLGFQNNHRVEVEGQDQGTTQDMGELDVMLNTFSFDAEWITALSLNSQLSLGVQSQLQKNKNDGTRILVPDANENDISAFAYLKSDFDLLELTGGLRYDYKKIKTDEMGVKNYAGYMMPLDNNYQTFNWALGGSLQLTKNILAKLNFATGFRSPNLAELSSNGVHEGTTRYEIGNPFMKDEKNIQGDAGFIYRDEFINIQASYFYNHVYNYIYLNPTDRYIGSYNVFRFTQANANLTGGEFSIDFKPVTWFDFLSAFSTVTGKQDNGSYLPLMPADKIISKIKFSLPAEGIFYNNSVDVTMRNYLKQDKIALNETVTPGYSLFDAGINTSFKALSSTINASIVVTNIFNKVYFDALSLLKPLGVYDMGRNIVIAVNYPFNIK